MIVNFVWEVGSKEGKDEGAREAENGQLRRGLGRRHHSGILASFATCDNQTNFLSIRISLFQEGPVSVVPFSEVVGPRSGGPAEPSRSMPGADAAVAAAAVTRAILSTWGNSFPEINSFPGGNSFPGLIAYHSRSPRVLVPLCSSQCCRCGGEAGSGLLGTCIQLYCRFSTGMPYRSLSLNWLRSVS